MSTTSSFKTHSSTPLFYAPPSAAALELAALNNTLLSGLHLTGPTTSFRHSLVKGGSTV